MSDNLSIRPLARDEHAKVVDYFHSADDELLIHMGVERARLRPWQEWLDVLSAQFDKPLKEKQLYYVGWQVGDELIGHSNLADIAFGVEAKIHLHVWDNRHRGKGYGPVFFQRSIEHFMAEFELQRLICEPKASNQSPNAVLQRLGYTPVKEYVTVPGPMNFEQVVARYEIVG